MKQGYIAAYLDEKSLKDLYAFSKKIDKQDLVMAVIDGKKHGGIVSKKAHLTLFFGFEFSKENISKLKNYLPKIKLHNLKCIGIDYFDIPNFNCKLFYLKIKPTKKIIKVNNDLSKLLGKANQYNKFIPHISLAYVKKDFVFNSENNKILPSNVKIKQVKYRIKS